jgi:hypothetical protein
MVKRGELKVTAITDDTGVIVAIEINGELVAEREHEEWVSLDEDWTFDDAEFMSGPGGWHYVEFSYKGELAPYLIACSDSQSGFVPARGGGTLPSTRRH